MKKILFTENHILIIIFTSKKWRPEPTQKTGHNQKKWRLRKTK